MGVLSVENNVTTVYRNPTSAAPSSPTATPEHDTDGAAPRWVMGGAVERGANL